LHKRIVLSTEWGFGSRDCPLRMSKAAKGRYAYGIGEVDSALRNDWDEHPIVRGSTDTVRAIVDLIPVTDEASDSAWTCRPREQRDKPYHFLPGR